MKRSIKTILKSLIFVAVLFFVKPLWCSDDFSVPKNLEDNVMFWKKIYTEVSLKEGFIHDRDYPMIIYRWISIGNRSGKQRRTYIKENIRQVELLLEGINRKSPDQWNDQERGITELFKQYASIEEIQTAADRVRFQLGQKERFKEGLERAEAYMPHIISTLEKYGIPVRIAYLPHVESSFNLNACSRVGATGIWQFMRSTARIFKLKMDKKIDERRDPIKSTIAAARLLQKNFQNFQSWPLAITAYNHGPQSIKRAVEETGSHDLGIIIDQYKNRRFKFASKNFYGCFLAASEIAAEPEKYFADLNYHPPLKFNQIQLKKSASPAQLSRQLGISQDILMRLNPSIRPVVFKRQLAIPAGFTIRIPIATQSLANSGKQPQRTISSSPKQKEEKVTRGVSSTKGNSISGNK